MIYLFRYLKLIVLVTYVFFCVFPVIATTDLILIGHKDIPVNYLSQKQLKRIFLGKTTIWNNGDAIIPCIHSYQGTVSQYFYKIIVKKSVAKYKRYWNKQLFSGNGIAPKQFSTVEEIVSYVKSNKGALCFVDNINNTNINGTKVVKMSAESDH